MSAKQLFKTVTFTVDFMLGKILNLALRLKHFRWNIRKTSFYILPCLIGIACISWTYLSLCEDSAALRLVDSAKYENLSYSNLQPMATPSIPVVIPGNMPTGQSFLEINFDMLVRSILNYDNVFQTAPWNRGMRLELIAPHSMGLVVGSRSALGYTGLPQLVNLNFGEWYRVRIRLSPDGQLRVWINNHLAGELDDSLIQCEFSDIAIGTGFNKSRPFHGEIKNFSINYKLFQLNQHIHTQFSGWRIVLGYFIVASLFLFALAQTGKLQTSLLSLGFILSFLGFTMFDVMSKFLIDEGHSAVAIYYIIWSLLFLALLSLFLCLKCLPTSLSKDAIPKVDLSLRKTQFQLNDPLLILRFFAFFCVFVTHCVICYSIDPHVISNSWQYLITGCAHSGMAVFFTLSGYLMGKAFYKKRYLISSKGILDYYSNRALRILPLYLFAAFLVSLLVYPEILIRDYSGLWRLLTFNYYANDGRPIGALWSLSTEMQYYLIAPFVFYLLSPLLTSHIKTFVSIAVVLGLGLWVRGIFISLGTDWRTLRFTPLFMNLPFFLIGFFVNSHLQLSQRTPTRDRSKFYATAGFSIMLFIYWFASYWEYAPIFQQRISQLSINSIAIKTLINESIPYWTAILTAVCIFCLEQFKSQSREFSLSAGREKKISLARGLSVSLQWLGTLTYGLYVWHPTLLTAFGRIVGSAPSLSRYVFNCGVGGIYVLALAILTFHLIEKPFDEMKRFR